MHPGRPATHSFEPRLGQCDGDDEAYAHPGLSSELADEFDESEQMAQAEIAMAEVTLTP